MPRKTHLHHGDQLYAFVARLYADGAVTQNYLGDWSMRRVLVSVSVVIVGSEIGDVLQIEDGEKCKTSRAELNSA